jgi:pimeloyl-ACP methyl ester carboxylesterase
MAPHGVTAFFDETAGLSGLEAVPSGRPRGLLLALHGGGYDARYWHHSEMAPASLLTLGALLGYHVIAVDRPGYRGSAGSAPLGLSLFAQPKQIFALVDRIDAGRELPLFVIGHSMGGILTLIMAAAEGSRIAAVDVSGVPLRYPPEMVAVISGVQKAAIDANATHTPAVTEEMQRIIFYGPDGSFNPKILIMGDHLHPMPLAEAADAAACPERLPPLLGRISAPVQWTVAEQETSSVGGEEILDEIQQLLTGSRHVRTQLQRNSGHNISLHYIAMAYHLRAFAFFEEAQVNR